MTCLLPSLYHEYNLKELGVTLYDRVGLEWNNKLPPFGELLSGQASVGLKVKLLENLTWNVVDVSAVIPLTKVTDGDPRGKAHSSGVIAWTSAATYRF